MESQKVGSNTPNGIGDDLLKGAHEIAKFLFGRNCSRRKIYYLAEHTRIPIFRIGAVLCARRSVLLDWIVRQELRALSTSQVAAEICLRSAKETRLTSGLHVRAGSEVR